MSPEQFVAVLVALTGLVAAVGVAIVQIMSLRKAVDGRLSELVEATRLGATKQGEMSGRAWERANPQPRQALDLPHESGQSRQAATLDSRDRLRRASERAVRRGASADPESSRRVT